MLTEVLAHDGPVCVWQVVSKMAQRRVLKERGEVGDGCAEDQDRVRLLFKEAPRSC